MASITEALKAALDLHGAGRLDEAATLYGRILSVDPEHARTLYFAGTLLCQQGRFADARGLLVRALAQEPDLVAAHANLAKIDAGADDWNDALAGCRRIVALAPADAPAWELLGTAERRNGRADDAIAALRRAHRLVPGTDGSKLGLLLFERGRAHLDARRNAAALADLTAAAALMPFDPELGFARATALVELGRDTEAVALCERLMAWSPAEPPLLHNLGVALMRTGRADARLNVLRRASALDPDNPEPCHALAAAFDGRDPEEARRWSTRALSLKLHAVASPVPPVTLPPASTTGRTLDVVSFSLWGRLELYCGGALENARRIPRELPGWRCRFYHDDSVPAHVLAELTSLGAELVGMPNASTDRQGLFWRFFVADDPTVRRFLCRDCDSRTTAREHAAVRAWLDSGLPFHVMRDHVMHMEPVMGGMWGGVAGHLPPLRPQVDRFTASRSGRWDDQHFLAEWLWPRIAGRVLVHDDLHGALGQPFPEPMAAGDSHVGAKLFPLVRLWETRAAIEAELDDAPGRHGRLVFPAAAPHIGDSLETLGEWLETETALCARFLKPGGMALDASAGIGAHALAFAKAVGPRGQILAVEPSPGLFACLVRSLALNGEAPIAVCRTLPEAVSRPPSHGRVDLVRATLASADAALDPLILEIAARHRPAFYFRIAGDGAQRDAATRLMPLGYRLWWHIAPVFNPANRKGRVGNPFPGLVSINTLALPDERGDSTPGLTRIDTPDSSWQEAAWHVTCDGL
ncbi:tetratricopeptide repeat protein [Azospirillum doebereinerae]|uniref:tetratricopeptide repeat protein n=1 Tax=Azospirillum doebereinerae TaxID=92933 RepID=UPI001EE5ACCC|nr:tetratricopeptide repeat protein [Azospirillum doebereinerae]MCG5240363.1 tetratricopeptide repeat protein [Azospirillum doebereinerae]